MCNLIQTVFTMINNPLFPELSPHEIFATEQQKLSALQNHYSLMRPSRGGIQCQRPLTSRNTTIPPTGMEEQSSLIVLTSPFCLAGALHTSAYSERASLLCISY